jgi:dTDP-4-amino-4,6-dideoxygalactose transaminase
MTGSPHSKRLSGSASRLLKAMKSIVFNRPDFSHREFRYVKECLASFDLAGDGSFTSKCHMRLQKHFGAAALLTHSCTAALEIAAMLVTEAGDEVIMPSFTFVSTANAFVLRGAKPVFVDIRPDTLNIDERLIEDAITPRTRAIVPVHYAGVSCAMDVILDVAARHQLPVIEDAAQGYLAQWDGRPLGSIGSIGTLSFHQSKNVVCGEGGALIINDPSFVERAHILREKGTNRTQFFKGEVKKYEWLDIGSSYLPSDIVAAVLLAQLEVAKSTTAARLRLWHRYDERFQELEHIGMLRRPVVPDRARHNGHIYYVVFETNQLREQVRLSLLAQGIEGYTHYVPLHSAPAGRRYGCTVGPMAITDKIAANMLRMPIHSGMKEEQVDTVVDAIRTLVLGKPGLGRTFRAAVDGRG